jgi:hypothetical protein
VRQIGAPAEAITPASTSIANGQADLKTRSTCHIILRRIVKFVGHEPGSVVNGLRGKLPLLGLNAFPGCDGRTAI